MITFLMHSVVTWWFIGTESARLLWELRDCWDPTGCGPCMRFYRTSWF